MSKNLQKVKTGRIRENILRLNVISAAIASQEMAGYDRVSGRSNHCQEDGSC
jgi:hypothetical protein